MDSENEGYAENEETLEEQKWRLSRKNACIHVGASACGFGTTIAIAHATSILPVFVGSIGVGVGTYGIIPGIVLLYYIGCLAYCVLKNPKKDYKKKKEKFQEKVEKAVNKFILNEIQETFQKEVEKNIEDFLKEDETQENYENQKINCSEEKNGWVLVTITCESMLTSNIDGSVANIGKDVGNYSFPIDGAQAVESNVSAKYTEEKILHKKKDSELSDVSPEITNLSRFPYKLFSPFSSFKDAQTKKNFILEVEGIIDEFMMQETQERLDWKAGELDDIFEEYCKDIKPKFMNDETELLLQKQALSMKSETKKNA